MKIKCFIHAQYNEYEKTFTYSAHYCNMEEYGYTLIETRELEFAEPSHSDLVNKTISALRAKQKKIIAESQKNYEVVQETINNLLCIEHVVDRT